MSVEESSTIQDAQSDALRPIHTYHCLCTSVVLATTHELETLPHRASPVQDNALILAPPVEVTVSDDELRQNVKPASSFLVNTVSDRRPVIVRREDGFEKRLLLRCGRCRLVLGYKLDEAHFEKSAPEASPVYLLPGGMLSTNDMASKRSAPVPAWAERIGVD
ncbi:hypothetical protein ABEF95_006666 [Exophiala dermatitidis]